MQSLEQDELVQLYNYKRTTEGELKGVVMHFHGYGTYTGKFGYFADCGDDFVGFNFRGFGRTQGQQGHIHS